MRKIKYYNEDIKMEYLNETKNPETRKSLELPLRKAESTERMLGKDLYEMTLDEIGKVMYDLAASREGAAYNNAVRIEGYINWTVEKGYRKSNITPFLGVNKSEWSKKYVALALRVFFTREEILDMCKQLHNVVDRAILLALFEGLSGKGRGFQELLRLRREDITKDENDYKVTLYNDIQQQGKTIETSRVISITETLGDLLIAADEQEIYISKNGESETNYASETKFVVSPYVFKKTSRGRQSGDTLGVSVITRKFKMFQEVFGYRKMNAGSIVESGKLHMANEIHKEFGEFRQEHLQLIGEQFNTPASNEKGRNASALKKYLDVPEFEDLYGYELEIIK